MNVLEMLKEIFEQKGFFISEDEYNDDLEFDSIQFISIIIAIEESFSIEIDDNELSGSNLHTFNDFIELIEKAIK